MRPDKLKGKCIGHRKVSVTNGVILSSSDGEGVGRDSLNMKRIYRTKNRANKNTNLKMTANDREENSTRTRTNRTMG